MTTTLTPTLTEILTELKAQGVTAWQLLGWVHDGRAVRLSTEIEAALEAAVTGQLKEDIAEMSFRDFLDTYPASADLPTVPEQVLTLSTTIYETLPFCLYGLFLNWEEGTFIISAEETLGRWLKSDVKHRNTQGISTCRLEALWWATACALLEKPGRLRLVA